MHYRGFELVDIGGTIRAKTRRGQFHSDIFGATIPDARNQIDRLWKVPYPHQDLTSKQLNALETLKFHYYRHTGVFKFGRSLDASCCMTDIAVMRQLEKKGLVVEIDTKQNPCHSNRLKDTEAGGTHITVSRYEWTPRPFQVGDRVVMSGGRTGTIERIRKVRTENPDITIHWKPMGMSHEFSRSLELLESP